MSDSKKTAPSLYIRVDIPEKYINEFKEICSEVVIEPWEFGETEPQPTVDLSKFDILYTLGLHDNLSILKKAPKIKWVHSDSAGVEAMLNEDIKKSDVIITNVKGCSSVPIAEHTIAMLSSLARGVPTMIRNQIKKNWVEIPVKDLENSTVGIIGYGDIGFEIAKRSKGLGMTVIGCRRNPAQRKEEYEPADLIMGMDQVDEVLSRSDFVVLALPFTKDTSYFLNEERINKMKKGSHLINVGRGNTIVDEDLIESLKNGHIAGAALDVFEVEPLPEDHPFWQLENVMVSPHNAYNSAKHLDRVMELFLKNLKLFSDGKPLKNVVEKGMGY
ncbi:D-2-hydroxyacid dehydrogenase [Peribacillus simplex]|uniref:D-2-hydroxyacid dehydrogenase n=1 Tax=Peribacillus simplex TaxID=1478 RepID=A0AAW7IY47_9BACI|nr:D-2-hydroxyacid dehydrogenase [Peribacillus simplex]MDM5455157.1 D-2-hydroxyacid dehydrogenase [Peribacillus simplex]